MKIQLLVFAEELHRKNFNALMNYPDFEVIESYSLEDVHKYKYIYSPNHPIPVCLFPDKVFLFGPHFSVLPDEKLQMIAGSSNAVYIQPSEWVVSLWRDYCKVKDVRIASLPFAVDVDTFRPIRPRQERSEAFVYFKSRDSADLQHIAVCLEKLNIRCKLFDYSQKYNEADYVACLQNAKFGIIIDAHESQGFAILEALSCDVPLFVWSVTKLSQEFRSNYPPADATTVPYWDARCGEVVTEQSEIPLFLSCFLQKVEKGHYQPRSYILQNLTRDICSKKMKDLVLSIGS